MRLAYWTVRLALKRPYHLSFGSVEAFDTAFLRLDGEGRTGLAEVTPLPGYSAETIETTRASLDGAFDQLAAGTPIRSILEELATRAPMVASGLACAFETWEEGAEQSFETPVGTQIKLAALCAGGTPADAADKARRLCAQGHRTLKLKIGTSALADDIARVRAVAAAIPADASLRLDANQALDYEQALALSAGVADGPIALLEQPFAPDRWEDHARLAHNGPLPLMLDESIWTLADIERARSAAQLVKLKLCKHCGMAETEMLARRAREFGLGVVFGNGVQTALGNHLEARLYARMRIETDAEISGFDKLAEKPRGRMTINGGALHDAGFVDVGAAYPLPETAKIVEFDDVACDAKFVMRQSAIPH